MSQDRDLKEVSQTGLQVGHFRQRDQPGRGLKAGACLRSNGGQGGRSSGRELGAESRRRGREVVGPDHEEPCGPLEGVFSRL